MSSIPGMAKAGGNQCGAANEDRLASFCFVLFLFLM